MLDTSNLPKFLKGITDAIRVKKGTTESIEHKLIDEEIASIRDTGVGSRAWWLSICSSKHTYTNFFYMVKSNGFPLLNTSKSTDFSGMFMYSGGCSTIPLYDTSNGSNFSQMFYGSFFEIIPSIDTSNGINFSQMFYYNINLKTISTLDLSNGKILSSMFLHCPKLENISFVAESIKNSISFAQSEKLTDESIQSIIDGLAYITTAQTLTLSKNVKSKLTEEQIAIINEKGWTLA